MGILALIFIFGIPGGLLVAFLLYAFSNGSGSSGGNSGCLGSIGSAFGSTLSIVGIFFAVFLFEENEEFRNIVITIGVGTLVAIVSFAILMAIKKAKLNKTYNDKYAKTVKLYEQKYLAVCSKLPTGHFVFNGQHLAFDSDSMYHLYHVDMKGSVQYSIKCKKTEEKITEELNNLLDAMYIKKIPKRQIVSWFYELTTGKIQIVYSSDSKNNSVILFFFYQPPSTKIKVPPNAQKLIDYLMKHIPDKRDKHAEDIDRQWRNSWR